MPLHFYLIEAEMTQQNAQSTSEPTISENDLMLKRPGTGIGGLEFFNIIGKKIKRRNDTK